MSLDNAGLLELLAFSPPDGRQLVLPVENVHAAGRAGPDAAAGMHQLDTSGRSCSQQTGACFDLDAHSIWQNFNYWHRPGHASHWTVDQYTMQNV